MNISKIAGSFRDEIEKVSWEPRKTRMKFVKANKRDPEGMKSRMADFLAKVKKDKAVPAPAPKAAPATKPVAPPKTPEAPKLVKPKVEPSKG